MHITAPPIAWSDTNKRWEAWFNSRLIAKSKNSKEYVQRTLDSYLRTNGQGTLVVPKHESGAVHIDKEELYFSVQERFDFIERYVKTLAHGKINSFILTGSSGIGKSTIVLEALQKENLRAVTAEELLLDEHDEIEDGNYVYMKGYTTAKALYKTMHETNGQILVLDDMDKAFDNPDAAMILKAALDDKKARTVSWNISTDDGLPRTITYTGRIIFISNQSLGQFPEAILSRSQKVDLTLNLTEMLDRIEYCFKRTQAPEKHKAEVLTLVKKYAHKARDLNVRSAVALLKLRDEFGETWVRPALYSFTA